MISVSNLSKNYGNVKAVDSISFELKDGEVVGFLGANGAGKTTTLKMITGYLVPTNGEIKVNGLDIVNNTSEIQEMIGYLPELNPLYTEMRVYDYLEFYIDDQPQGLTIGGETDWNLFGINLPTGEHTLRWVYEKDDATSFGEDCAWIDRIQLPPGAVFPLDINFGDLNFDNQVNILDIIVTVNHVAGHIDLNGQQIENADMNLDGTINILDVILMVDWANSEQ